MSSSDLSREQGALGAAMHGELGITEIKHHSHRNTVRADGNPEK